MRYIFSLLLLFISLSSYVYGDRFFEDGNIVENKYYDTLGYGIGELIQSKKCPSCVEYISTDVYGTFTSSILSNTSIFDVTNPDPVYGLIRLWNVYDQVALPPHSSLNFIYWSKNESESFVNIVSLKVFLSRYYPYKGDLRKLLNVEGVYEDIPIKYIIWNYPRSGIVKTYPGLGVVPSNGGIVNGMVLDTVYVKSPLYFFKWEASLDENIALLRIYVRNDSDEYLKNISFNHESYSFVRDFQPYEEYMYEYEIDILDDFSLGYASVYNPNEKKECIVIGQNLESNHVGESVISAGIREENGKYLSYIGSRVKPLKETFCVTRIPYRLYSEEILIVKEKEDIQSIAVEDTPLINEENISEVLGITKLPQTSTKSIFFLVVISILWYYLIRRLRI